MMYGIRAYIERVAKAFHVSMPEGHIVASERDWSFLEALATPNVATAVSGSTRGLCINGQYYWIKPNVVYGANDDGIASFSVMPGQDAWLYILPDGSRFTHADKFGALLMCLKHAGGGEWAEWIQPEFSFNEKE